MKCVHKQGRIQDFKLEGVDLKNVLGVFRVTNHDFTPKNHIVSNFRGEGRLVRPLDPPLIRLLHI